MERRRARRPVELELDEVRLARATAGPTLAWLGSVALHAAVLGVAAAFFAGLASGAAAARAPLAARPPTPAGLPSMTVELVGAPEVATRAPIDAPRPSPGGAERAPRADTGTEGRGAREDGAPAWNLAHRLDDIALSREQQSRLDRSQVQRTRDGDARETTDPRRAISDPMELTFVLVGHGATQAPRAPGELTPAAGTRDGRAEPAARGGDPRPRAPEAAGMDAPGDASRPGELLPTRAAGALTTTAGAARVTTADVSPARPQIAEGRPANPAPLSYRSRDDVDAQQEVAATRVAALNASAAGGVAALGPGGDRRDATRPGAGGDAREGTHAAPNGHGGPGAPDPDPLDARLTDYRRRVAGKIDPLWGDAFPRWAALEGRQGRAIVHFVIRRDGSVELARVVRSSGIAEFDENVRRAVLRAAPFGPLPDKLGASLPFYLSFDSQNPAVR